MIKVQTTLVAGPRNQNSTRQVNSLAGFLFRSGSAFMSRMLQFVSLIFQGFPNMHRSSMQHDCMFPRGDDAKEIDTAELSVGQCDTDATWGPENRIKQSVLARLIT
jgi:hypothetical protein